MTIYQSLVDLYTVAHNCHGKSKSLTAKANSLTAKAHQLNAIFLQRRSVSSALIEVLLLFTEGHQFTSCFPLTLAS